MTEIFKIDALGSGGDGIARHSDGAPVFIPLTVPGDVVRARVGKDREGHYRGVLGDVVEPGPGRVTPPCSHFGTCGGCRLQHMSDSVYAAFKKDIVTTALQRAGVDAGEIKDVIVIPPATRRRASFSAVLSGRDVVVGFNLHQSDKVMDVPDCRILKPEIITLVSRMKPYLKNILPPKKTVDVMIQMVEGSVDACFTGRIDMNLRTQETFADMVNELGITRISVRARERDVFDVVLARHSVTKTFGGIKVNLPPGAFLQASDEAEAILTGLVMDAASGARNVADLFCGAGTFTGPLSTGRKVVGVDVEDAAIQALKGAGIKCQARNLFQEPMMAAELDGFDAVVLDPPRAGAQAQVRELARSDVPKIIYVSCNPQSFAKDARVLQDAGYRLLSVQPVDAFRWAAHIESVGIFMKQD